jgi:hypothetical protein
LLFDATADSGIHQYAPVIAMRRPAGAAAWQGAALAAAAVLVATIVLRAGLFGNAITGLDEQFYLLVGERMWHGALPFVDIWDRKPVGLFVLFAAIAALPGDPVVNAQLVATMFAAGTAFCIALIARRTVGWAAASMAGIFYVAGLNELWDDTTQASVFYNLLVAGAALLTLHAGGDVRRRWRAGAAAMVLAGIAVQLKTNAIFAGGFFGLWIVGACWRATGSLRETSRSALILAALGAVPTVTAMGYYAAAGEFGAWWQANVLSVLAKGRATDPFAAATFMETLVLFTPAGALALVGLWRRTARFTQSDVDLPFLLGWVAASVIDFVSIGGYFPHYAAPLLLACAPLTASAFAWRRAGRWLFGAAMLWPVAHALWVNPSMTRKERAIERRVLAALPADVRTRCLFIYEGPPIYYQRTQACFVSRYVFTAHLSSAREAPSLGEDPATALRAALARHPGTIVTVAHSRWTDRNPAQEKLLMAELRAHYRIAATVPYHPTREHGELLIWRRL